MFSDAFRPDAIHALLEGPLPATDEIESILRKSSLTLEDLAGLVRGAANPATIERVCTVAAMRRHMQWQERLFLMPPLYISNGKVQTKGCADQCKYCGWRKGALDLKEIHALTEDEIEKNVEVLRSWGYEDVELVAATDIDLLNPQNVARAVRAAKNAGARQVGINILPLEAPEHYTQIAAAGVTFTIVWQETYHAPTYEAYHGSGPKQNMRKRLDAHDRALLGGAASGLRTVGVAFLGGLYDWRFETLATMTHARYLRDIYGANVIFGMPRHKGAGAEDDLHLRPYSDDEYRFVGALYSLAMPDAMPWFSTREDFHLSYAAASGGGCLFTVDCSTVVGGYWQPRGRGQFPVYSQRLETARVEMAEKGFAPRTTLPWTGA
jgi:2-iminoacetate synthase